MKNNELENGSYRNAVLNYVKRKYKTQADYPWKGEGKRDISRVNAVLRHKDNQKWYGLIMDVDRTKLGLPGEGMCCIINVKTDDQMFHDALIQQEGYFPGYHMNKEKWLSILLDGTVPFETVCDMIDTSYQATASVKGKFSGEKNQKARPAKEWIVPANPKYYDIVHAFDKEETIEWKQGSGIRTGDTVFLYAAAPVSAILYRCKVLETDIPYRYQEGNLTINALMKIKLLGRYPAEEFTFEKLKKDYGIFAVRGPRGITPRLSAALKKG